MKAEGWKAPSANLLSSFNFHPSSLNLPLTPALSPEYGGEGVGHSLLRAGLARGGGAGAGFVRVVGLDRADPDVAEPHRVAVLVQLDEALRRVGPLVLAVVAVASAAEELAAVVHQHA